MQMREMMIFGSLEQGTVSLVSLVSPADLNLNLSDLNLKSKQHLNQNLRRMNY